MAKLDTAFQFTGRIEELTFFKRQGSDQIIIRRAVGHSRDRLKKDPKFARVRDNNNEFKAVNKTAKLIHDGLHYVHPIFDHIVYNSLVSRIKSIQKLNIADRGKRNILLSEHGQLLENIPFNKKFRLEDIILISLQPELDAEAMTARLNIPSLRPGIHYKNPTNLPFLQFRFLVQAIPDVKWENNEYSPRHTSCLVKAAQSEWYNCTQTFPATELKIDIPDSYLGHTIIISLGIAFSKGDDGPVKYIGAGRIIKVEPLSKF